MRDWLSRLAAGESAVRPTLRRVQDEWADPLFSTQPDPDMHPLEVDDGSPPPRQVRSMSRQARYRRAKANHWRRPPRSVTTWCDTCGEMTLMSIVDVRGGYRHWGCDGPLVYPDPWVT